MEGTKELNPNGYSYKRRKRRCYEVIATPRALNASFLLPKPCRPKLSRPNMFINESMIHKSMIHKSMIHKIMSHTFSEGWLIYNAGCTTTSDGSGLPVHITSNEQILVMIKNFITGTFLQICFLFKN